SRPDVAYYVRETTRTVVRYAWHDALQWRFETVDAVDGELTNVSLLNTPYVGSFPPDLTLLPQVTYQKSGKLYYSRRPVAGHWDPMLIDPQPGSGRHCSGTFQLVFGESLPAIAYASGGAPGAERVRLARFSSPTTFTLEDAATSQSGIREVRLAHTYNTL